MQLIAWSIPGFIALMAIEAAIARRRGRRVYHLAVAVSDVGCGITSQLFNIFSAAAGVAAYVAIYQWFHLFELDAAAVSTWLLGLLLVDLAYYWWHRTSHEVNLLWAAHIVHHHSEDLNLGVALRQALFTGLTFIPFAVPLALLGVPPLVYFVCKAIDTLYQFWIHTELVDRVGPAEAVLNTPSHHRVHHAINPQYLDRNYGGILIVWDRLFGSFEPEVERPVYGTTKPLRSLNPLWANLQPLLDVARLGRSATTWRERLYAWVAPPGWRPSGDIPPASPDELRQRAAHRFDVPAPRAVAVYVAVQAALAVPATMLLLLTSATAPAWLVAAGAAVVAAGTVAWAGLFERRRWAWPLELGRVAAGVVLLRLAAA